MIDKAKGKRSRKDRIEVAAERLARVTPVEYQIERKPTARQLDIPVRALDDLVKAKRPKGGGGDDDFTLPHWNVGPWPAEVSGAELLNDLWAIFHKYIYAPAVVFDAAALWVVHAWTINAGDISPFFVLVSPTKRCGKTNMLILLMYLTPKSELASNISPSALFRYVEDTHPTLLIDEADSFVGASEEMRGILNSGHTRIAANVIRNVEINGEHKPKRFSVWAAKAIATIRDLADTLEDRSIIIQLQRKPKTAEVARLRKRDDQEFATLRQKASRWAEDNFGALAADPDPAIPDELNDRAADNWRPLIAIANLAGGDWPRRAREAACILSGAGHEAKSINVELLADIKLAFGHTEAMWSEDLVGILVADQERPWATWSKGRPLTQNQLGRLLSAFKVSSEVVWGGGVSKRGYKRVRFEEAWASYLPGQNLGQNTVAGQDGASEVSKCQSADTTGTSRIFQSVRATPPDTSKNSNLSYSHAGSDTLTDKNTQSGTQSDFDQDSPFICDHCGEPSAPNSPVLKTGINGEIYCLHPGCQDDWLKANEVVATDDLSIPDFLRRVNQSTAKGDKP